MLRRQDESERVAGSTRNATYAAKFLRLITPEKARELGIPAEAPVFVSPIVEAASRCPACRQTYSPLVYQVGYATWAQLFCPAGGGIYVLAAGRLTPAGPNGDAGSPLGAHHPFVARVELLGRQCAGRSEGVVVRTIQVYPAFPPPGGASAADPLCEGFLLELVPSWWRGRPPGFLYPVPRSCDRHPIHPSWPRFAFGVFESGAVHFESLPADRGGAR